MKMKNYILILSLLFTLFSCKKSDSVNTEPEINLPTNSDDTLLLEGLSNSEINIDAKGDTVKLILSSSNSWVASCSGSWVALDKTSGDACEHDTIMLTTKFNFSEVERKDTLKIAYKDYTKDIKILLNQPKWEHPQTKYQVGDPEAKVDLSGVDASYPYYSQMKIWSTAGCENGIPHLEDQLSIVEKTFEAGTSAKTIADYFYDHRYKNCVVLLKNGEYTLDQQIRLYSRNVLIGESRDGVILNISTDFPPKYSPISMYNATDAGLRNVTIKGHWLNADGNPYPKYKTLGHAELPEYDGFITVNMKGNDDTKNDYIDNCALINNACHPIWTTGSHKTIRNVNIDGAYNMDGGCQGYLFLSGHQQLITGCNVTRIRHISFQGEESKQNVFYDNDLKQEVTFHCGDGGDMLIENNRIHLMPYMFEGYNAIMGPWSSQHYVGGQSFIYKNKCQEDNPGRNGCTPWSDDQLYRGPWVVSVGDDNPSRYKNFTAIDPTTYENYKEPSGGTLYPVNLGNKK